MSGPIVAIHNSCGIEHRLAQSRNGALSQTVGIPRDLRQRAAEAKTKHVLLSHLMLAPAASANAPLWSLTDIASVRATIAHSYRGRVDHARDLQCIPIKK